MKRTIVTFMLAAAPFGIKAETIGIGAMFGDPTGITGKVWLDSQHAIDMAAEWRTRGDDEFYLHANYLVHAPLDLKENKLKGILNYYYGVGGFYEERNHRFHKDEDVLALRLPIGVSHQPQKVPVELFAEFVPVLEVSPDSDFDVDVGIGVRYLFQ